MGMKMKLRDTRCSTKPNSHTNWIALSQRICTATEILATGMMRHKLRCQAVKRGESRHSVEKLDVFANSCVNATNRIRRERKQ